MTNIDQARKNNAIKLRLTGQSYREISSKLKVARSTLNIWLKDVQITPEQKQKLHKKWQEGLKRGRLKASQTHTDIRLGKIRASHLAAKEFLKTMPLNKSELELFLAGLYLGDGFKIDNRLGLGNADPKIVLLFTTLLRQLYKIKEERLRAAVFGRADQKPDILIKYWSDLLNIPANQFHKTQLDIRTKNKASHSDYFGVCAVSYNDTDMQRRILAIGKEMVKYVNQPPKGL